MRDMIMRPEIVGHSFGGHPLINFEERDVRGKRRLIGVPNKPMRMLHRQFGEFLRQIIYKETGPTGYGVRKLPSSFGCIKGSNPLKNALKHRDGKYFYITDLTDAYATVSLERLAILITYLIQYDSWSDDFSIGWFGQDDRVVSLREDRVYIPVLQFLQAHFAGPYDQGLAVGGPLSPYLMNLYCEVYMDASLRRFCEPRGITYTRYVDDLVFSADHFMGEETRRKLRAIISLAGFTVNRRKSWVRILAMGQASITQIGLARDNKEEPDRTRLVFPQKKRRRLHGIIYSYLASEMDWPEKVSGYVAEFLYYYKNVIFRTATDKKTFALCRRFQEEWERYGGPKYKKKKHH